MKTLSMAIGAAALGAALSAAPATARNLDVTGCASTDITPAGASCEGFFNGNLNAGSPTARAESASAMNALFGTSYTAETLSWLEDTVVSGGSNIITFSTPLYGQTILSVHVGAATGEATGVGYQSTAFYMFDAGNTGITQIAFNRAGLSNARLYSTGSIAAVPEPASWGLMIAGFAGMGVAVRRRRRQTGRVTFA